MLVKIANSDSQNKSDLGLRCLPRPFRQATSVGNFRTFTEGSVNSD